VNFSIALHFSNLSDPNRIVSFLLLPFQRAFDPSLAYLAVGAMPAAILLYHFGRGKEQPRLGGRWAVPKGGRLIQNYCLVPPSSELDGEWEVFAVSCLRFPHSIDILIGVNKIAKRVRGWSILVEHSPVALVSANSHLGRFCRSWRPPYLTLERKLEIKLCLMFVFYSHVCMFWVMKEPLILSV
jgi:hypothetical protein